MKVNRICHIILVFLTLWQTIHAEENHTEIMVDFRVNVMRIDPSYADNSSRIEEIVSFLKKLSNDSSVRISSVAFCGAASPEGSYDLNRRLAAGRLASLESLIRNQIFIPDSLITRDDSYIPWRYLRDQVSDSDIENKETIISIIDEPPSLIKDPDNGKLVDHRIVELKRLDHRRVWNELFSRYFSHMRNASAVIITYRDEPQQIINTPIEKATDETVTEDMKTETVSNHVTESVSNAASFKSNPLYLALSTNMLYDALAIPNMGIEAYIGKNISIGANWMHAWWSYDRRHRYWRLYGGEINIRYWFGNAAHTKPLTGHHIGIYAQTLTFDFEFGGKAYMGVSPEAQFLTVHISAAASNTAIHFLWPVALTSISLSE